MDSHTYLHNFYYVRPILAINRFNLPHFCARLEPRPGFPLSYVIIFFMFIELKWEAIVIFVDIGDIVDQRNNIEFTV